MTFFRPGRTTGTTSPLSTGGGSSVSGGLMYTLAGPPGMSGMTYSPFVMAAVYGSLFPVVGRKTIAPLASGLPLTVILPLTEPRPGPLPHPTARARRTTNNPAASGRASGNGSGERTDESSGPG